MVEILQDACRFSLEECDLIQQSMVWRGSSRDRAVFSRVVHSEIRRQVRENIRNIVSGQQFEKPKHVDVEFKLAELVIDSLRTVTNSEDAVTTTHQDDVVDLVTNFDKKYDDYRRQQIISNTP